MSNIEQMQETVLTGSAEGFTFALDVDGLRIVSPSGNHSGVVPWRLLQDETVPTVTASLFSSIQQLEAGVSPDEIKPAP